MWFQFRRWLGQRTSLEPLKLRLQFLPSYLLPTPDSNRLGQGAFGEFFLAKKTIPLTCKSRMCTSCGKRRADEWAERLAERSVGAPTVRFRQELASSSYVLMNFLSSCSSFTMSNAFKPSFLLALTRFSSLLSKASLWMCVQVVICSASAS